MADAGRLAGATGERERPTTLATAMYEQLRADIVSAALLPGARLGMDVLRARYGVGASPLREALNRLVSEGLVTQADQKGFRVAPVSAEELRELTRTRRLINEIALREAIRNGDAAWEERIVFAYHRMTRAPRKAADADRLHREFHDALIVGCGSRLILDLSQQLFDKARRYQLLSISAAAPVRDGDEEHRQIMEAVLARDVDRAVRLANDHIGRTETIVLAMNCLPNENARRRPRLRKDGRRPRENKLRSAERVSEATYRIAADIGGTFTDVAAFDEATGELRLGKTLTTPQRLVDGIAVGVAKARARFSDAGIFLHGSTIAINTLLERTGARTALITTEGFRDVYEIGRVNRPDAYNLFFQKHEPLVERALRFELRERVLADGTVRTPLARDEIVPLAARLDDLDVEAVAIMFLHCYRNPDHERAVKQELERRFPGLFVSASHELSQEYREFERCSTVVANAYIGPRVRRYLAEMEEHLEGAGFHGSLLIVQSTGGLYEAEQARSQCVRMLESGPAAGVIGTRALCRELDIPHAIAFDMGGTTAKAGVIHDGEVLTTGAALIGGYERALPVQIAMIDIFEVSAGGGSIARLDETGALRVGPQSAGADPGPACYGLGGLEPTITDANVVLGRLGPDRFLGGEMRLDHAAAHEALRGRIAVPLGKSMTEAAEGILRIAVTTMSYAVKGVTTERGLDAGNFTLIAYGGAGPLHATAVGRELGIRTVIIPQAAGVFSSFGMLFSDLRYDFVRTRLMRLEQASFDEITAIFTELEDEGRAAVAQAGKGAHDISIRRGIDMRYVGQEHAVTVDVPLDVFKAGDRNAIKRLFDDTHDLRYGTCAPEEAAEIVSLRTTVMGVMKHPPLRRIGAGAADPAQAATGSRKAYFAGLGAEVETPTFDRARLLAGNRISGPAFIEEHASTTVLLPGDHMQVDRLGNLVITIGERQ